MCYTKKNYFYRNEYNKISFILSESNGRYLFYYRKEAEGARCRVHLNSQAKGPLPDRTLESFLINTEGVISNISGKISQVKRQGKKFLWSILPFFILICIMIKKYYQKVEII